MDKGEKIQIEILKKFSGEKRVHLGAQLYEMSVQLIKDGIHHSRADLSEEDIDIMAKEIISPWFKKRH